MTPLPDQVAKDVPRSENPCIHDLFEMQADLRPEACALAIGDDTLTYGELNRRANRVAKVLRDRGIGPNIPVAVFTWRSFDTVTAILGILKAGAAYLALDPTYPIDRLKYMLEDSGTQLILTHRQLADHLPRSDESIVNLDVVCGLSDEGAVINLRFDVTPDDPAYLIYTSGSAGKPKGVLVTHRNLVHSTRARDQYYRAPVTSFLLLSSFSFDSSVAGIFWTLCSGGTLVIADETLQRDPVAIVRAIGRHRVSHLLTVPSLYALILDELQTGDSAMLRVVVVAGEPCPKRLVKRHLAALPHTGMYNEYGPTEATVWCTAFDCSTPIAGNLVPIGKPIIDTQLYILDDGLQPTSTGSTGELYIGGPGVSRGYLNRPNLTRERFVPNPFLPGEADRLYRTGDLARSLPDGNVEFLGRIDQQVKIRGFRVELGEIETTLRAHREVTDVVVTTREAASGNTRLVAYVLPRRSPWPSNQELLVFLRKDLPEYMVPSTIILLGAFPLLPNGKVDRGALPLPGGNRPELDHPYVPPRTSVEQQLSSIWADVLAIEDVGIEDSFFELGGDSLLSMQIVARARQHGLAFTSEQIARHGTISSLASHVRTGKNLVSTEQALVTGTVPLTPRQWKYFEEDHNTGGWIEQTALDALEAVDPVLLEEAARQVISHHDALRMRFTRAGGTWTQHCAREETHRLVSALEAAQLRGSEWQRAIAETQSQATSRLDVHSGPLLQLAYLRRVRKPGRLFIYAHHLVVDAYSISILVDDLETAWFAALQNRAPDLPPKTTSYKAWAEHLQDWAHSNDLQSQMDYWCAPQVESAVAADLPWSATETGFLKYVLVELPPDETDIIIHDLPRMYGVQINDILLTALVIGLSWRTHSRALLVDVSTHGRESIFDEIDVSRTIGWFACGFPVVLDLEAASNPIDALRLVHEQLQTVPSGGIGYGVLRFMGRDASTQDRLRRMPQPIVGLNYQGRSDHVSPGSQLFSLRRKFSTQPPAVPVLCSPRLPVSGHLHEGKLFLRIRYHDRVYRPETVDRIGAEVVDTLRSMVVQYRNNIAVERMRVI
jgi:amino acid adenylation domain-containing protein/non-ribosomal peptide synthase protein (TIGR01720 family)